MAGAITVGSAQVTVTPDASRFASDLRAKLGNLPSVQINVDADTTAARARIDDLARSQTATINVDADTARARVAIDEVAQNRRSTINVDADTGAARAQLASVGSAASGSASSVSGLMAAGIALGPAIIPVAASVAAALAAVGAAAGAGLAGVGVLALGFSGVSSAVKALGEAQSSAGKDARSYAASQQSAAFAITNAESGVQAAEESLANARANAANAAISAAEQVKNAQLGVADATRQAAAGVQSALLQEQSAEQSLTSAQREALSAQQALNDARAAAKQNLEDLAHAVADGALQQRASVLAIQQAKQNLDATLANPKATELQREQAQLAYDQAVQQLSDVQLRNQRLADQKAAADKAGIDGSKQVQQAQQGIASSTQRVADAQAALARAQAGVTEAQRKGAEQVAKAQQSLADAERAQANQQRQSAASISSALRGVENAQRSLAQAHASAAAGAGAASAATTKLRDAMAGLSPEGREFARFIFGLRPEFEKLKAAAQGGLLPGVQAGIEDLLPLLPGLTTFVGDLATAMGDLFREAGKALTSPFWQQAIGTFEAFATPAVSSIGHILGDIATGFAGLFTALAPLSSDILGGLGRLASSFADFGKDASGGGLQGFIDYVRQTGPTVVSIIGNLASVAGHLVEALAPFGAVLLGVIDKVTHLAADLGPQGLLLTIGAVAAAVAVFTGGLTAIVAAAVAVGAELTQLYQHVKPVHDALDTVGSYIRDVLVPVVSRDLSQALDGLRAGLGYVEAAYQRNKDSLNELVLVLGGLADVIVRDVLPLYGTQMRIAFETLGRIIAAQVDILGAEAKALIAFGDASAYVEGKVGGLLTVVSPLGAAVGALVNHLKGQKRATDDVQRPTEQLIQNQQTLSDATARLNDELQKSISKFTILKTGALDQATANDTWASALDAVAASAKQNGTSLDINTEKGRANRQAVEEAIRALNDKVSADFKANESTLGVGAAMDIASKQISTNRQNLLDVATQSGLTKDAAKKLVDQILLTPAQVKTQFQTPGLAEAQKAVQSLNAQIQALHDKTIQINLQAGYLTVGAGPYQGKGIPIGRAAGGAIEGPGSGTSDSIPAMLSNGEHVWTAAEVKAAGGHGAVSRMRQAVRGFAAGGPVVTVQGSADTSAAAAGVAGIYGQAAQGINLGGLLAGASIPTQGAGGGVTRWASTVLAALSLLGQSPSLLPAVLRRIQFESSGNPAAINLTDINAIEGHPSQGLMQVIPSTFAAYAGPLRGRGITDPLANIYAGLNYAEHRYGSIAAIDPKVRPYGYDSGGMLEPGVQLVYNGTGRPERVLDANQTALFEQAMAGTGGGGEFTGELYLDSGQFLGVVQGAVRQEFGGIRQTARVR